MTAMEMAMGIIGQTWFGMSGGCLLTPVLKVMVERYPHGINRITALISFNSESGLITLLGQISVQV